MEKCSFRYGRKSDKTDKMVRSGERELKDNCRFGLRERIKKGVLIKSVSKGQLTGCT